MWKALLSPSIFRAQISKARPKGASACNRRPLSQPTLCSHTVTVAWRLKRPLAVSQVNPGTWAWLDLNQRPHPYQVSRAKRCADRRFPRSLASVGGEGMRSNNLTGPGRTPRCRRQGNTTNPSIAAAAFGGADLSMTWAGTKGVSREPRFSALSQESGQVGTSDPPTGHVGWSSHAVRCVRSTTHCWATASTGALPPSLLVSTTMPAHRSGSSARPACQPRLAPSW
jgi:hypothetical protein